MRPLIEYLDAVSALEGYGSWADADNLAPDKRKLKIMERAFELASESLVSTACKAQKMLILTSLRNVKPDEVDMAIINAPEMQLNWKS